MIIILHLLFRDFFQSFYKCNLLFRNHFTRFIINDVFLKKNCFQKRYLGLLYILSRDFEMSYLYLRTHCYYIRT